MSKNKIKRQKKDGKKILKIISIGALGVLIAGTLGFTSYWTITNWDKVNSGLNGANLYTEEDLKYAKEEGYLEALENKVEYEKQIEEFKEKLLESNGKITELENKIKTEVADYELKINELQSTIDANSEEYQAELSRINEEHSQAITALQTQLAEEQESNSILNLQIESLNAQILDLQQKISAYEEIIRQYENDETAPVSFYDGETLIKATLVSKGSTYSLDESLIPANTEEREFVGWAVAGLEVDSDTFVINSATVFNAVFKYKVNYVINGEKTSLMIKQGTALSENAPEVTPGANQEFAGWVNSNGQAVDLETQITEPITITAEFNTVYNITFNYDEISTTIRLVNGEFEETVPSPTAPDGYRLSGWTTDNGFYDTTELKNITEDTTLIPKYIKLRYIKIKYRTSSSGTFTIWNSETFTLTCGFSLNSTGDVAYYILVNNQISAAISQIAKENGKANPNYKCLSLVENANPYLYSTNFDGKPPFHELDNSTEDVYIYLTLQ